MQEAICPWCGGTGEVPRSTSLDHTKPSFIYDRCAWCFGMGFTDGLRPIGKPAEPKPNKYAIQVAESYQKKETKK